MPQMRYTSSVDTSDHSIQVKCSSVYSYKLCLCFKCTYFHPPWSLHQRSPFHRIKNKSAYRDLWKISLMKPLSCKITYKATSWKSCSIA